MNNTIDPSNSKLDIEILVNGTDEEMSELVKIIKARSLRLCVEPVVGREFGTSNSRRKVTFSVQGPTDLRLETVTGWMDSLLLEGRRDVNGTITPLHD
ncbi:MAG: hypothetical protein ACOH2K_14980 [Burkholderiaceae bacterium]